MKVAACICWYDEPPESLRRLTHSLAGFVDVIIACDGAWETFPGGKRYSPESNVLAMTDGVSGTGVHLVIRTPTDGLWESEVKKRNAVVQLAKQHLCIQDWLLVIDGDEYLSRPGAQTLLALMVLSTTTYSVGFVGDASGGDKMRRLFRAHPDLEVRGAHNSYWVGRRRLSGLAEIDMFERARDLSDKLVIHHERSDRPKERNLGAHKDIVNRLHSAKAEML